MKNPVVVKIHNESLVRIFSVANEEEGIQLIKEMAEDQLERKLTEEEIETLEDTHELFKDEDWDNHYCWAIGEVEDDWRCP